MADEEADATVAPLQVDVVVVGLPVAGDIAAAFEDEDAVGSGDVVAAAADTIHIIEPAREE